MTAERRAIVRIGDMDRRRVGKAQVRVTHNLSPAAAAAVIVIPFPIAEGVTLLRNGLAAAKSASALSSLASQSSHLHFWTRVLVPVLKITRTPQQLARLPNEVTRCN